MSFVNDSKFPLVYSRKHLQIKKMDAAMKQNEVGKRNKHNLVGTLKINCEFK